MGFGYWHMILASAMQMGPNLHIVKLSLSAETSLEKYKHWHLLVTVSENTWMLVPP